jgi:hypothetical protein
MTNQFNLFVDSIIESLKFNPVVPSYYDVGWKGKIVNMSPQQFLKLALKLPEKYFENCPRLDELKEKIGKEQPMDIPMLMVDVKNKQVIGHEGRHRARAALDLGIKEMPVFIFTGSCYPRVPKWTEKEHSEVDKVAEYKPENT